MTYDEMLEIIADTSCFMSLGESLSKHGASIGAFKKALEQYKYEPIEIEYQGTYVNDLANRLKNEIEVNDGPLRPR